VAAVELPGARGEWKNRTKTFLGNPFCQGADKVCTELLNTRDGFVAQMLEYLLERLVVVNTENLELVTWRSTGRISG
jgi:hypothetical protein